MDAVFLARLQFAITICFHFIFPPLTIGMSFMLCIVEWLGWRNGDQVYIRMGKLFSELFTVTFAVGVASGVVMVFQFGTNWAGYSHFVSNIFGAPLAIEAFFAFFLESTFMGLYVWGRGRVSKGVHWFSLLMVTFGASTLSAFFIIAANSWQQTPAGYILSNGRAELTDIYAAIINPSTMVRYFHVITGSYLSGAFVFAGVGAWHLLQDSASQVARHALRLGITLGLVFAFLEVMPIGHENAELVARTQPEKFAAIEGLYQGRSEAPLVLFGIPASSSNPPKLRAAVEIPGLLSLLAFGSTGAYAPGIMDFPREDWPPLEIPFISYHIMAALGFYFIGVMLLACYRYWKKKIAGDRWLLKTLVWSIPLPVIAIESGWITAEVGRQPWVVYKLLRTSDAASSAVSRGELTVTLVLFTLIYLALLFAWLFLMILKAKHLPAEAE